MKKFLMAICALAVVTTVASAAVGISWSAGSWGYAHDGTSAILDNNSALWQLIYAGVNNTIDPIPANTVPTAGGPGIADDYVMGDDVVWAERSIPMTGGTAPEDSTAWDNWLMPQGGSVMFTDMSWTTAGFVYQRVFESSTPLAGSTYFYETGLLLLDTSFAGGTATPQDFFADPASGPLVPNQQAYAVPEPATMGLLGLGALVMAIRRRRS